MATYCTLRAAQSLAPSPQKATVYSTSLIIYFLVSFFSNYSSHLKRIDQLLLLIGSHSSEDITHADQFVKELRIFMSNHSEGWTWKTQITLKKNFIELTRDGEVVAGVDHSLALTVRHEGTLVDNVLGGGDGLKFSVIMVQFVLLTSLLVLKKSDVPV